MHEWRESNVESSDKKTSKSPHSAKITKSSNTDKRIKLIIPSAIVEDCSKTVDNTNKVVTAALTQAVQDGSYLLNVLQAHISATTVQFIPKVTATPKQPPDVTLNIILKRADGKPE